MIQPRDIHSLTDFQRHARDHLKRLKKTGRPHALTVNGKAQVIVQDAQAYQELLDTIDHLDAIAGVSEGLKTLQKGQGKSALSVLNKLKERGI